MIDTYFCNTCQQSLPLLMFGFKDKLKTKRRSNCKQCCNKHNATYRNKNKDKINQTQRDNTLWLADYKIKQGCKICGYRTHSAALEFHHRDPDSKKANVTHLRSSSKSIIEIEIAKCDVLCSNCHRILEYEVRQSKVVNT